jgi:hypothetical protein
MARIKIFDKKTQSWVYADESFSSIPIKGVDYYTEEEKVEFKDFIRDELTKRGQLKPEFANTVADCKDQSKLYVLPDGFIYAYMYGGGYTNQVSISTDTDGSVYNGNGYIDGYCLDYSTAGATLTELSGYTTTGFIPMVYTDVIRMSGATWDTSNNSCIIAFYDKNKKPLGSYTARGYVQSTKAEHSSEGVAVRCLKDKEYHSVTVEDGVCTFNMAFNDSDSTTGMLRSGSHVKYVRIAAKGSGADMIVTVNQEIAGNSAAGYDWRNTGHAFVPADYEDRIVALEQSQGGHSGVAAEITPSATASELSTLYEKGVRIVVENPKDNLIPSSIDRNGVVFNGCGYRKEYRLTNTGGVEALDDAVLTGFIPYVHGKTIQISGGLHKGDDYGNYMAAYNSAFETIYAANVRTWVQNSGGTELCDENNIKSFSIKTESISDIKDAAYIRISLRPCVGRNMQVRYI